MKAKDAERFQKLMRNLCDGYMRAELTSTQLDFYFDNLRAYGIADVERALGTHARHPEYGRFFPRPADIVREIRSSRQAAPNGSPDALDQRNWPPEKHQLARIIRTLYDRHGRERFNNYTVEWYWLVLRDHDMNAVRTAAEKFDGNGDPPRPEQLAAAVR